MVTVVIVVAEEVILSVRDADLEGVSEVDFALDADEVLLGIMVARDGGNVVCPELKTAHAPDKTTINNG